MQILDNFIIVSLHILCFIAGMKLANYYHEKAQRDMKDALQSQYLRLISGSDADDPCKPYHFKTPLVEHKMVEIKPTGDYDGDAELKQWIPDSFVENLKENGKAKVAFRKSDVRKD